MYSGSMMVFYGSRKKVNYPFPPETHGFFYYWANPDIPAEGQIRFRVTRDSDPSSFANGHDLLGMDGLPWCITLFQALNISKYGPLGELLVKENLVTEGIAEQARSLRTRVNQTTIKRFGLRRSRPVMKLGQVFPMYLANAAFSVWTDRDDAASMVTLNHPWTHRSLQKCKTSVFDAGTPFFALETSPRAHVDALDHRHHTCLL